MGGMKKPPYSAEQIVRTVYHYDVDARGNEVGEPHPIYLLKDGTVDVESVPKGLRDAWIVTGLPSPFSDEMLRPEDGASFINALFRLTSNPNYRFTLK